VSSLEVNLHSTPVIPPLGLLPEEENWYAIHTMPRHERRIAGQLQVKGMFTFLPMLQQVHRWSDRRSKVEVPMFSCYVFLRMVATAEERLRVLRMPGVFGFVGSERRGTPIPDEQIESLRTAIDKNVPCLPYPFVISPGNRVRIRGGSLDGIEGILVRRGGDQSLVVSVELLCRSVSIRVEGYDIESI
jgi:transcription antitermination factor NusG